MKIIVCGSRDFDDVELLDKTLRKATAKLTWKQVEIVVGGQEKKVWCSDKLRWKYIGADRLAADWALDSKKPKIGIKLTTFHADWDKHGKKAGPIRNKEMAVYADACIAFWDGQSPGTKNMIALAETYGLKLVVVRTDKEEN
jgi:hypothetical protein